MAASITFCLDAEGNGSPCTRIFDGGVEVFHEEIPYPYHTVPTEDLVTLVAEVRALYEEKLNDAKLAADDELMPKAWVAYQFSDKLFQLISIMKARPDYIP